MVKVPCEAVEDGYTHKAGYFGLKNVVCNLDPCPYNNNHVYNWECEGNVVLCKTHGFLPIVKIQDKPGSVLELKVKD